MIEIEIGDTTFGVNPQTADWYYCLIVEMLGETDYLDGYATGKRPTRATAKEAHQCRHSWVAGMMYVHEEDLDTVSAERPVTCEQCDAVYGRRNPPLFKVLEFEVNATPQGAYSHLHKPARDDSGAPDPDVELRAQVAKAVDAR